MKHSVWIRNLLLATILSSGMGFDVSMVQAKDVVSNKMAVPLKKAEQLMKQGKYAQADAEISQAQAMPNATQYERDIITQLQIASALKQNKVDAALVGYSHLLSSPRLTKDQRIQTIMAQASASYRARKYADTIKYIHNYFQAGGTNPHMQTLLIQTYYLSGDYKSALHEQQKQIDAETKSGSVPAETQWQFMVNCQEKLGDTAGAQNSYVQLAMHYPKPEYWAHVMNSLTSTKGMSPQVEAEVWHFRNQAGLVLTAENYMAMAEVAVQAGYPNIGIKSLTEGRNKGLFTGANADRAKRLEDYINKLIAQQKLDLSNLKEQARKNANGDDLFKIGYDAFFGGDQAGGLKIMQEAMLKPMLNHNIASLQLALSQAQMGDKKNVVTILKSITGQNVPAELATLWLMKIQTK